MGVTSKVFKDEDGEYKVKLDKEDYSDSSGFEFYLDEIDNVIEQLLSIKKDNENN